MDLQRIEKLLKEAESADVGPWDLYFATPDSHGVVSGVDFESALLIAQCPDGQKANNANFIAGARTAIPELCRALKAAKDQIAYLEMRLSEETRRRRFLESSKPPS